MWHLLAVTRSFCILIGSYELSSQWMHTMLPWALGQLLHCIQVGYCWILHCT